MPNGWSKPRDLARLAEMRARFEFEIPLGDLPGIPAEFSLADGPVRVWLQFNRERGVPVADVKVQAVLLPQCQRCLGAMRLAIDSASHVAVVDSEAQAQNVPEEMETFLAADGHGTLAALVAEELLLSLPIVPRHAAGERCQRAAGGADDAPAVAAGVAAATEETQRPFADLRALLERSRN